MNRIGYLTLALGLVLGATAALAQSQNDARQTLANFDRVDTNGDDAISRSEFSAARASRWSQLDRNGDGYLTTDDFPRLASSRAKAQLADIGNFDTNGDGRISESEFLDGPMPAFDRADKDSDGKLTRSELESMAARG